MLDINSKTPILKYNVLGYKNCPSYIFNDDMMTKIFQIILLNRSLTSRCITFTPPTVSL